MAYEKNTWNSGDVITSEKLNHIEQGVYDAHQSGSDLEVVAEIEVGEMTWIDETSAWLYQGEWISEVPDGSKQLYFNSKDYPLTEESENMYLFNVKNMERGELDDESKPGFFLLFDSNEVVLASVPAVGTDPSTVDLSNTTVRILAEASSGGGAEKFVVNLTENDGTWTAEDGVTIRDILDAYAAGKICVATAVIDDLTQVEIPLTNTINDEAGNAVVFCGTFTLDNPEYLLVFGFVDDGENAWQVERQRVVTDTGVLKVVYNVLDDGQGGYTATTDTSYSDIVSAMQAGKAVSAVLVGDLVGTMTNAGYVSGDSSGFVAFYGINKFSSITSETSLIHNSDNTVSITVTVTQ